MPNLTFHPDVANEVKASYEWYQNQTDGLGDDFLHELESAYQMIVEFPATWPIYNNHYRRFLLGKFPFSLIYREDKNIIYVVAIMHNSRKPGYWKNRT